MKTQELRAGFFKYTFFNILSTLGVSVYILIDTLFISQGMGSDGLTALNLCLPVFNFINGFGLMFGMGGGSRFSMLYCKIERSETDKIYTNAFWGAIAAALGFLLLGLCCSGPLTRLLGADDSVYELAHSYLHTVLLFSPVFILNNLMVCFLRNDAAPKLAMAGVLGSSFANIVLDYLFIFKLELGMEGAALATCISPLISMAIMSAHFISGWNAFRLRAVHPSKEITRDIMSLGLHALVTEISGGLVVIVFNFVIYRLAGNTGIAAYGVIANLAIVFTAIFTGLSSGVQPLLCQCRGDKDEDGAKYLLRLSLWTAVILAAVSYTVISFNTADMVAVFNGQNDAQLAKIAECGLRLYFLFMPFMGMNSVFAVYFTSCEQPFSAQLISLLRGVLLVIPLAFIFFAFRSLNGIWLTIPVSELLTSITAFCMYAYMVKPYGVYVYRYVPKQKPNSVH